MVFRLFLFCSLWGFCFDPIGSTAAAQDIKYAREVINQLTSAEFHGRGYVLEGEEITAQYIAKQFKRWNLQAFEKTYFQTVYTNVNTFPSDMAFSFGRKVLTPGKDFIVSPDSPTVKGEFTVVSYNLKTSWKKFRRLGSKILLIPNSNPSRSPEEADADTPYLLVQVVDKLTWETSSVVSSVPVVKVLRSSLPRIRPHSATVSIQNEWYISYPTKNVIGYIPASVKSNRHIVFSAHYDHLGRMGRDTWFPGANDNGSGVAMLLNLAKYFSQSKVQLRDNLVFMAFGAEELGKVGSEHYIKNPYFPLSDIKFLINMDMVGTGEKGIQVVNSEVFTEQFELMKNINDQHGWLNDIKKRGKAESSDHYWFTELGVPSFFVYTLGGITAYHDIYDRPETLPMTAFENLFKLLVTFTQNLGDIP